MPIISVDQLSRTFKVNQKQPGLSGAVKTFFQPQHKLVHAVDEISFKIEPGELVGFIGPNGAGKTTTLKMLSGLLYPSAGQIDVLGFQPFDRRPDFLKKIALVMGQKNQLIFDLPAMDSFLLNQAIYEIPEKKFKLKLKELTGLLNVEDLLTTPVRKLSLGQRMKMELVAALLHEPEVLFLDEPSIGLDVVAQQNVREFVRDYNQQHQATIILTSHYMGDVRELCSRLVVINHGRIIFDGSFNSLIQRYARNKLVTVELAEETSRASLEKIGKLDSFDFPRASFKVPRIEAAKFAAQLLTKFSIADVSIEEPPIEAIIREFFASENQGT